MANSVVMEGAPIHDGPISPVRDRIVSNWAIICCKYEDDTSPTGSLDYYRRLFTGLGSGSNNMTDYFLDMSHGILDTSGSEVFGWYTLPFLSTDYIGGNAPAPPGQFNRTDIIEQCRQAAIRAHADLSPYVGTVVVMNSKGDIFGVRGGMVAMCETARHWPSAIGQEMGHGYGLDHSRQDWSAINYQDPYDTMSTLNGAYYTADPTWELIGPGLNAANMRSQGWLDESRVWTPGPLATAASRSVTLTLRPLHWSELPGYLAAELPGGNLVEFRVPERWDAGIPGACVLVHRFADNHSYLMSNRTGKFALAAGDDYSIGNPYFGPHTNLHVDSIDTVVHTAVIRIEHSYRAEPSVIMWPWYVDPGSVFSGLNPVTAALMITSGEILRIAPDSPLLPIVEAARAYQTAEQIRDADLRAQVLRSTLRRLIAAASDELQMLDPIRVPAPPNEPIETRSDLSKTQSGGE